VLLFSTRLCYVPHATTTQTALDSFPPSLNTSVYSIFPFFQFIAFFVARLFSSSLSVSFTQAKVRWIVMFTLQLVITIGSVVCAADATAAGSSEFLSSNVLFLLVEMYRVWATTSVSMLCGCCAPKTMLTLNWMIDSGCDFVGCILYSYYSKGHVGDYVLFIGCTFFKLIMNFFVFMDGCRETIEEEAENKGKKITCKDICSKGCGAFLGGANGAMGIGYAFFGFFGTWVANQDSVFGWISFLLVVQIHVFITTTYMYAKLDNMIDDSNLAPRSNWMFPQFDVAQPFDVLAYYKFELCNLFELILYCIIILIFMVIGMSDETAGDSDGWVYMFGIAAACAGIVFLLFVMFLVRRMNTYHQGLSPEEKAQMSGASESDSLAPPDSAYGAPKIMAVA